jgi:hypothetical protein
MAARHFAIAALVAPALAHADANDLVLGRLTERIQNGSNVSYIPQNAELRSLASELGVVLAPHMMTPADTLGFGGFQLTVDYTTTTISDGTFWRAREGTDKTSAMQTVGFFARKGMWFPIPSFEIGAGATHLVDSNIWTAQLYTKLALVEGYHQLPIPSVAARGAVSRMMSQRELDLTIASLDITASKHFGIGGTWRLDPFVGWNLLMIIPRSEVIDPTPNVDQLAPGNEDDSMNSFVFKDQATIFRQRIAVGVKMQFHVVQLTAEATFALKGSSKDDRTGTNEPCMPNSTTTFCDAEDAAGSQRTISVSAGVDF